MLRLLNRHRATLRDEFADPAIFREPERACRSLQQMRALLTCDTLHDLVRLLGESPDPDQALNLLERLMTERSDMAETLGRSPILLHYAIVIFTHSYWLGETLLRHPDILAELAAAKDLERLLECEEYGERLRRFRSAQPAEDLSQLLALFKKREYVRIALRDALGIGTLAEVTAEISALADAMIHEALREAELQVGSRYGHQARRGGFAVIALGKLGGNELNYSSDVDLFYLYREDERCEPLSCDEYFIRQAQLLTSILSRSTSEGTAFRIDLRLRPQGREGEPAVSLERAVDYYGRAARDWELQALIKGRHVAGDAGLTSSLLRGIRPRVYTKNLNFAAIETALHSRQKLADRRRSAASRSWRAANRSIDVKLDPGGIRDIEFLAQCLQRVYGGSVPWLRSSGTLLALQKLHEKDHLESRDFQELSHSYEFLRGVEHRLQLQRGQQVHCLPETSADLEILGRSLRKADESRATTLLDEVRSSMARVNDIYRRVIHSEQGKKGQVSAMRPRTASRDETVQDIAAEFPALSELLDAGGLSRHGRRALQRFLDAGKIGDLAKIGRKHYSGLLEDRECLRRAIALFENSEYLTELLVRHSELLHQLRPQSPPEGAASEISITSGSDRANGLAGIMEALRRRFRARIFSSAARDVMEARPALDSMRETTRAAEDVVRSALRAVRGQDQLAIFALGRLGTDEFDIASDADLLFVRDPRTDEQRTREIAERLVHVIGAYTREGTLFAVDARLRPRGGEGELVVTPAQLENYLASEAQPWEALTYSKIRFIAGRSDLASVIRPAIHARIVETAGQKTFPFEVRAMRTRLEKSNRYAHSFKLARGGFYDVDFIASFLMLRKASLHDGNTLERLQQLRQAGVLDGASLGQLANAAVLFRTADHVIRLVTGRALPQIPESEHAREATFKLVNRILLYQIAGADLQLELQATQEQVRRLFHQLIQ